MPPPPVDTGSRFLLIKYEHVWVADTLYVEVGTDKPCHLYLRWTDKPLRMHNRSTTLGGYYFMTDPKYCFVEWRQVEQDEPGDSLEHTFHFAEWAEREKRWWGFVGTVEEHPSPSATSVFTAEYGDYKTADKLTIYFSRPPAQSSDDAHIRWFGAISLGLDYLRFGAYAGARYSAGFRFPDIPLGKDDVPVRALLCYRAYVTTGPTWLEVAAELNTEPSTFSTYADFVTRSILLVDPAFPVPAMTEGNWYNFDVTELVKILLTLTGWKKGNPMVLFIRPGGLATAIHEAYSWEEGTHLNSPFLWLQV